MSGPFTHDKRAALQAQLQMIDAALGEIEKRQETIDRQRAAYNEARQDLLAKHGVEDLGECVGCQKLLLANEPAHHYGDGPIACEACAPTVAQTRAELDEARQGDELPEAFDSKQELDAAIERLDRRIAEGHGDQKHVW